MRDLTQWLEEFRSAVTRNPSQDSDSERPRKVATEKHRIYTRFSNDRNCEICKRTKITRAPGRKRIGTAVPRVENFGDLTTTDQKVLNEDGDSRNNHRHGVVVQDLATQWIQSHPCETTRTSQETERSSRNFLEPSEKPKVTYTAVHWNLANPVKTCRGIIEHQHPIDPRQNGIAERALRRIKERTSARAWMKHGRLVPWTVTVTCETSKTSWQMGQHFANGDLESRSKGPVIPSGSTAEYLLFPVKTSQGSTNLE